MLVPGCDSLKRKRMVLRSVKDKLARFNVSVAETAHQDTWTRAELTVAYVAANNAQADSIQEKVDALVDQAHDVVITRTTRHAF